MQCLILRSGDEIEGRGGKSRHDLRIARCHGAAQQREVDFSRIQCRGEVFFIVEILQLWLQAGGFEKLENLPAMRHIGGNADDAVLQAVRVVVEKVVILLAGVNGQRIVHVRLAEQEFLFQPWRAFHAAQHVNLSVAQHCQAVFPGVHHIFVLPVRGIADPVQVGYKVSPQPAILLPFDEYMLGWTTHADGT